MVAPKGLLTLALAMQTMVHRQDAGVAYRDLGATPVKKELQCNAQIYDY